MESLPYMTWSKCTCTCFLTSTSVGLLVAGQLVTLSYASTFFSLKKHMITKL